MLPENFFEKYWRQEPVYLPNALPKFWLDKFEKKSFFKWAAKTKESVRLFHVKDIDNISYGRAVLVRDPKEVETIYQILSDRDEPFTFHMNSVEKLDSSIKELRDNFEIPFDIRMDDIIATLSTPSSGIGYHSGHEDGFIVQLSGKRRWRVWSSKITDLNYKIALLDMAESPPNLEKPEGNGDLLVDVITSPGDILYIPPFCPHEGKTLEESLSLSIAWRGLAPLSFLRYAENLNHESIDINKAVCLFKDEFSSLDMVSSWQSLTMEAIKKEKRTEKLESEISSIISGLFDTNMSKDMSR